MGTLPPPQIIITHNEHVLQVGVKGVGEVMHPPQCPLSTALRTGGLTHHLRRRTVVLPLQRRRLTRRHSKNPLCSTTILTSTTAD